MGSAVGAVKPHCSISIAFLICGFLSFQEGEEEVKWELGFALFLSGADGIGFTMTGMPKSGNGKRNK